MRLPPGPPAALWGALLAVACGAPPEPGADEARASSAEPVNVLVRRAGAVPATLADGVRVSGRLEVRGRWPAARGCVQSEVREVGLAGVSAPGLVAASGLRVLVWRGSALVGQGQTGESGCFEVSFVPGAGPLRVELRTTLGTPTGETVLGVARADASGYWRWTSDGDPSCGAPAVTVTPTAGGAQVGPWTLREACGSGAAAIFRIARQAVRWFDPELGAGGEGLVPTLAVRWSPGVQGDCVACFLGGAADQVQIEGDAYATQVLLSGREHTPSHWSPSVIAHEVGHWAMAAYSRSPTEQGKHALNAPCAPGLAYKEGWATAFGQRVLGASADGAGAPVYRTMLLNQVYWVDLRTLDSTFGVLALPAPALGVAQPLHEFVVASALWKLWTEGGEPGSPWPALGESGMRTVLASERLRGELDRGYPGLDLLDFLDASVCEQQATSEQLAALLGPLGFPWEGGAVCE